MPSAPSGAFPCAFNRTGLFFYMKKPLEVRRPVALFRILFGNDGALPSNTHHGRHYFDTPVILLIYRSADDRADYSGDVNQRAISFFPRGDKSYTPLPSRSNHP